MARGGTGVAALHRPLSPASAPGTDTLRVVLEAVLEADGVRPAISHASRSSVREALTDRDTVSCPVVRGRTLWPNEGRIAAIVDWPNRYGLWETTPPAPADAVVVTDVSAPLPEWRARLVVDHRGDTVRARDASVAARFGRLTRCAGDIAAALVQLRGVALPHGRPEAPHFIVIVPGWSAAAAPDPGKPITAQPISIPGLPGAVRVRVRRALDEGAQAEFVQAFASALPRSERSRL